MTSLLDLVGADGKFACPLSASSCPKPITDENRLNDIQFDATQIISGFIGPEIPFLFTGHQAHADRCFSISEKILAALLKSLTAEEFISLKKRIT